MGIESTFACNTLNALDLAEKGESQFRTSSQPMISGVSHAQRPPRQRLRSNAVVSSYRACIVGDPKLSDSGYQTAQL
jgi:hypothetical protein